MGENVESEAPRGPGGRSPHPWLHRCEFSLSLEGVLASDTLSDNGSAADQLGSIESTEISVQCTVCKEESYSSCSLFDMAVTSVAR